MQIDFDFCAPHFYACPMECENKAIVHKTNATVQLFYSIPWTLQSVLIRNVIVCYPFSLINVFIRIMSGY